MWGVASWLFVVWAVVCVWAGRGVLLAEGWAADRRALVCGVVGLSGAGMRDTPAAAWLGGGGCPRVCGGGMLSGFWGSAPWLPGPCSAALFVGGGVWVWVGWL